MSLPNHGDLDTRREVFADLTERTPCVTFVDGDLAHMKSLGLGRKFRLHLSRHEIDAKDWADHAEWIGDQVPDRGVLFFITSSAACSVAVLVIDPA